MKRGNYLDDAKKALKAGKKDIICLGGLDSFLQDASQKDIDLLRKDIYSWVKGEIKDPVLTRKLRNLKYLKNFRAAVNERVRFLVDVKNGKDSQIQEISLGLYVSRSKLSLDKDKCIRCDVSHTVCPKECIKVTPKDIVIQDKCVLCGVCVPFCPVSALELETNDEASALVKGTDPIPVLPGPVEINGVMIKKIFDGTIEVEEALCPMDCEECVSACPVGIIERDGSHVKLEKDLCVFCGACLKACPKEAITIKGNRIYHEEGFSAAWTVSVEKFLGKEKNNVMLNHKSMSKIKGLVSTEEFGGFVSKNG